MRHVAIFTLSIGAIALFSGCSNSAGVPPQSSTLALRRSSEHPVGSTSSYQVLFLFSKPFGGAPYAGLIEVNGTLYGTTQVGGSTGRGTVYSVSTTGTEKVLHSFGHGSDGRYPTGNLLDVKGKLYGTTQDGGSFGQGTVFRVTLDGSEKVLYNFAGGSDGADPFAGLIDVNGILYGTTLLGGASGCFVNEGCGTVFSVTTGGTENVLYRFAGGSDGGNPYASLIDVKGVLYGTTNFGGSKCLYSLGCGTVFSITSSGSENVLHTFTGSPDGGNPYASLINVKGTLYGTTSRGGSDSSCGTAHLGCGTVYSISPTGSEKVMYSFTDVPDGSYPTASLIDVSGRLYGTTSLGGYSPCGGCGTVYSVSKNGKETVLHAFTGDDDSAIPRAALINLDGTLYGTTQGFLGRKRCSACGSVFALTP
jgi:uncharacterized repeat protein (TIGR03803 family)